VPVHREFKTILAVALVAVTTSACLASAQTSFAAKMSFAKNPQVSVSVYDDARVSDETLARAEGEAARIFSRAGLDVRWSNCTATEKDGCGAALNETGDGVHLVLRITPKIRGTISDIAFGVAYLGSDGNGRYGDVFWERVKDLQENSKGDGALLLGGVMAHEMGHLLLGSNAHAVSGIMRAQWEHSELRRIDMDSLLFLPEQGRRMRDRVSRREEARMSSGVRSSEEEGSESGRGEAFRSPN
jgi:hypothetical protein